MNAIQNDAVRLMTKEELLAAPEEEYMSEAQLEYFRALLQAERQALVDAARETTQHLQQENEVAADWTDRATVEEEQALELRVRDRERKLLKKIEQSLRRIDDGSYGIPRLLARPTASLCLEAQERHEALERVSKKA
jgi:DnaK suppressor protein